MRVLVTGGAGFIGSHLVDALVARGDDVAVVDDMSGGRPGRVADEPVVHKLSVTEGAAVAAVTADFRPELICHLAARVDVRTSVSDPADDRAGSSSSELSSAGATGMRRMPSNGGCGSKPDAAGSGRGLAVSTTM